MISKCKNCQNWSKVGGTIKSKTEHGLCSFMNKRFHLVWTNNEPERDKDNQSLVINSWSDVLVDIQGISISTVDPEIINRHACVWTDAGFSCAAFRSL